MEQSFDKLFSEFLEFTASTFEHATALSSIAKLEEETREIKYAILKNHMDLPTEYMDAIGCIIDSAMRKGVTLDDLKVAMKNKNKLNKEREWTVNNGVYSHIKKVEFLPDLKNIEEEHFMGRVMEAVHTIFKLPIKVIKSRTKVPNIVIARQTAIYIMYNNGKSSYDKIGKYFNLGRSNVSTSKKTFKLRVENEPEINEKYGAALKLLGFKHTERS